MAYQLDFEKQVSFDDTSDGIVLEAEIRYSDVSVRIDARIDTGAAYSIFERRFGEELGLEIESEAVPKERRVSDSAAIFSARYQTALRRLQ